MNEKATSLRLPDNMAAELTAIARVDGNQMSDAIREALEQYIASRRAEPQFKERLKAWLREDREVRKVMERLVGAG